MPKRTPTSPGAHDLRLALGVIAFVIGLAMISAAVLGTPLAANAVRNEPVRPPPAELASAEADDRSFVSTRPTVAMRPTAGSLTAVTGTALRMQHGASPNGPGGDRRRVLMAMAMLQRRITAERPAGHYATAEGDTTRGTRASTPDAVPLFNWDIPPAHPPV